MFAGEDRTEGTRQRSECGQWPDRDGDRADLLVLVELEVLELVDLNVADPGRQRKEGHPVAPQIALVAVIRGDLEHRFEEPADLILTAKGELRGER